MPTNDRLGDPNNEIKLLKLLELLVSLASDEEHENNSAETFVEKRPKEQVFEDNQEREEKINQFKRSLPVRWDVSGLGGFEQSSRDQGKQQFSSEECVPKTSGRSEKNWLYFNLDNNATGKTVREISKCLTANQSRLPHESDISRALHLLQTLDCYCRCPYTASRSGTRRFALNFSACKTRTLDGYKDFIKNQIKDKYHKPEATPNRTAGSVKKTDPRSNKHLNDLVEALLPKVKTNFEARRRHEQKHIHVPLKATIRPADWQQQQEEDPPAREPQPKDFVDLVSANDSQLLFIWEEGGAGKTSLAYEIASWGLEGLLADYPLLPYFLDFSNYDLALPSLHVQILRYFKKYKRDMKEDDLEKLLSNKRVLLIVDHFSELTDDQRRWVIRELPNCDLALVTSRLKGYNEKFSVEDWSVTEIRPQRLQDKDLFDFFKQYLQRRHDHGEAGCEVVLEPEDITLTRHKLEHMVGHKPVTVLLAWLVIDRAIKHIGKRGTGPEEGPVDLMPSSVPALMEDYVRESCGFKAITSKQDPHLQTPNHDPTIILAFLKALALESHRQNETYSPQNFDKKLADRALEIAKRSWSGPKVSLPLRGDDLIGVLNKELTLITCIDSHRGAATFRISLDPLADYLAALAQKERWLSSGVDEAHYQQLRGWLDKLLGRRERGKQEDDVEIEAVDNMRGFLAACRDCYTQWLNHPDNSIKPPERLRWQKCLDDLADLAKIDPWQERRLEAKHLIRRHAFDLEWNNPELRAKAIAELTGYAQDFKANPTPSNALDPSETIPELKVALKPLEFTLAETSFSNADRAAAAEALGWIGGDKAVQALIDILNNTNEPSVAVRRAAAEALGVVDASTSNPQARFVLLKGMLTDVSNHLHGETDQAVIAAKLPLLQGASRGLQRLANRALPSWGSGPGHQVPMLSLTTDAGAVTTTVVTRPVWQLPLPEDIPLEIVVIEEGTWTIGSPPGEEGLEAYDHWRETKGIDVEAIRLVKAPTFAIARFPITQAQWKTLAGQSHRRGHDVRELKLEPAQTKGADLPVECVNWWDAKEWCARLQQHLQSIGSQILRVELPSESLWEVACRAGTRSPFHFGDTIDSAWANYDGTYVHGPGKQGVFLNRISSVGSYGLVNAWGLGDMHGNVWEWCADIWHPSPSDIPENGKAREKPLQDLNESRIRRGGSWTYGPRCCRASFRSSHPPNYVSNKNGFRPCFFFNTN